MTQQHLGRAALNIGEGATHVPEPQQYGNAEQGDDEDTEGGRIAADQHGEPSGAERKSEEQVADVSVTLWLGDDTEEASNR